MHGSGAVDAFFESYRGAFQRRDASAITAHFAFPLHITSATSDNGNATGEVDLTDVASPDAWTSQIDRLLAAYAKAGVASARIAALATSEFSPRLYQAVRRWDLLDARGNQIYSFDAAYTLAQIAGALRITALVHNERPQLQALLAGRHPRA